MTMTLAMFPGQGSQYVGMGRDLCSQFPQAVETFEEAEEAAGFHIRRLCFDGPESDLKLTANTQPAILATSVAMWRVLESETGLEPDYFAGHSLGEYSAAVAAGKLAFARAAYLVRRRGEAMQAAVPEGVGAMAAVMNMPAEELEAACQDLSKPESCVQVVNYNSAAQLVVAGHRKAVEALEAKLSEQGAARVVRLPVSAPFHSSLMAPARKAMEPLLQETDFQGSQTRIIANLSGKVEPEYGAAHLIGQIDAPVLWSQSMLLAEESGCDRYLEVGPGKVLFGLARRIVARGHQLLHTGDLVATIKGLQA